MRHWPHYHVQHVQHVEHKHISEHHRIYLVPFTKRPLDALLIRRVLSTTAHISHRVTRPKPGSEGLDIS